MTTTTIVISFTQYYSSYYYVMIAISGCTNIMYYIGIRKYAMSLYNDSIADIPLPIYNIEEGTINDTINDTINSMHDNIELKCNIDIEDEADKEDDDYDFCENN